MIVANRHQRLLAADLGTVGALFDGLASRNDRIWPPCAVARHEF